MVASCVGSKHRVEFWRGRQMDVNVIAVHLDGERTHEEVFAREALAGFEGKRLLVYRACDFWYSVLVAQQSAGEDELASVRAHVLGRVPLPAARKVKYRDLRPPVPNRRPAVGRNVPDLTGEDPFGLSHIRSHSQLT